MNQEIYSVGIYCRLSLDDGGQGDSSSIQTQKMILEKYCNDNNFKIYDYYIDDGFSGTNFNRPAFQRLIKDVENNKINLVITKDLSRLGRDYIQCGYYTEIYFPDKNIRYIALNDSIDTLKGNNDIAPFRNILNDMYSKDLSRKVKASIRQRSLQGLFMGSNAPYGYIKDPNNKNKLIVNSETALVVKYIFDKILKGYGAVRIARELTENKVLTPASYKVKTGDTRFLRYVEEGHECRWSNGKIYKIVIDPVYTGAIVCAKSQVVNYKTKKSVVNSKDKWIVVPNIHEAIISNEDFERAQKLIQARHIPRRKVEFDDMFKGLVKCAVCGKRMTVSVQTRYGKQVAYYRCHGFLSIRAKEKHWTSIKYVDVYNIVFERVKEFFKLFKDDNKLLELVKEKMEKSNIDINYEKELGKLDARINTLSNITKKVYDDYFEGLIHHETYQDLLKKYHNEQSEIKEKYNLMLLEKNKKDDYFEDLNKLKQTVNSFLDFKVLTREMAYSLIEKIEIDSIGGFKQPKQRTINITYRFLKIEL